MLTHKQVLLAISRIIRRKREKNEVLKNDQRQPKYALVAVFGEIQKELEKTLGVGVPEPELNSALIELVRTRDIIPVMKGFTLPKILSRETETIERHWRK
ncbi:MAG: hypothetical protein A2Z03_08870 [Chloroflexi bacterium RBG_16_56_8]|nr:MAG: hypothetical protein A2Z03_08870 [Chloroflexi bacterium RBG_16_56_8]